LREICPFKKYSPKYNAASGIIAGELLKTRRSRRVPIDLSSINTTPSRYSMLLGLIIIFWRHFLTFILLLLLKEEWREEWEIL
jgi:hypothetical protein